MAAYRRVYDSRQLQDQRRNPTLGNRVWAAFTFFTRRGQDSPTRMLAELALFMMFSFVSCFLHIQVAVERLKAYAPGSKNCAF